MNMNTSKVTRDYTFELPKADLLLRHCHRSFKVYRAIQYMVFGLLWTAITNQILFFYLMIKLPKDSS